MMCKIIKVTFSLLWWWYFLNHNTRDRIPAGMSVSVAISLAITNIKSNTNVAFVNIATITFNMPMIMTVNVLSIHTFPNIINTFNRNIAFSAAECEIPSLPAIITVVNAKISLVKNTKICVVSFLNKCAGLENITIVIYCYIYVILFLKKFGYSNDSCSTVAPRPFYFNWAASFACVLVCLNLCRRSKPLIRLWARFIKNVEAWTTKYFC